MRPSSDTWWLLLAAAASIGAAPLIMRGDAATNTRREQSRQALERMTPAERQRLDDSYERYKSLSPDDRARWKAFHAEIESERKDHPEYLRALTTYSEWIPSLSALQSDRVRSETNADKRVALIEQVEEQKLNEGPGQNPFFKPRFSTSGFYKAMAVIEKEAASAVSSDKLSEIDKLPPNSPRRSMQLIEELLKENQTFSKLVSDSAFREIVDSLGKKSIDGWVETADKIREIRDPDGKAEEWFGPRSDSRRWFVRQNLSDKFLEQTRIEFMKSPPADEELLGRLAGKQQDEREPYYSLAASDVKGAMRHEIFFDRMRQNVDAAKRFFDSNYPRWNFGRGPGDGRGFRGGDGRPDNRRRRGEREGRGPGDGNRPGPPGFGDRPPGRPDGPPPNENR